MHLEKGDFVTFVNTLSSTVQEWENGRDFGAASTPPTPLNILFHCGETKKEGFGSLFRDLGLKLEEL